MVVLKTILILLLLASNSFANPTSMLLRATTAKGSASVADGFIGLSSHSSADNQFTLDYVTWDAYTTGTAGQISRVGVWLGSVSTPNSFNVIISDSSGNKLVDANLTALTAGSGWYYLTLDSPITIDAATSYRLGCGAKSETGVFWTIGKTAAGGQDIRYDGTHNIENAMEATLDNTGQYANGWQLEIFADNGQTTPT